MKEMTTAEFAKANVAGLDEPVSIRRYTKVIGTYFPAGFEPATAPESNLGLADAQITFNQDPDLIAKVVALELEVRSLKKELAKRPPADLAARPLDAVSRTIIPPVTIDPYHPGRSSDPFSGLSKQDHDFFDRKLGSSRKK